MEQDRQAGRWLAKPVGVVFSRCPGAGEAENCNPSRNRKPIPWRRSPLGSVLRKHRKARRGWLLGSSRWHFLSLDSSSICKISISQALHLTSDQRWHARLRLPEGSTHFLMCRLGFFFQLRCHTRITFTLLKCTFQRLLQGSNSRILPSF